MNITPRDLEDSPRHLPTGFRAQLSAEVKVLDGGRVLVGGSPLTAVRLSPAARRHLLAGTVTVTDDTSAHLAHRLIERNLAFPDLASVDPTRATELTVVIPVRDRPDQLDRTLAALRPLRCLVVDDASHDPGSIAEVAAQHGACLLALPTNLGPAAARNAGLAAVQTPYVALVDSDVETTPEDLLDLGRHFTDPRVVVVAPRIRGVARVGRPRWFERYDAQHSSLTLGRRPAVVQPGSIVGWLPAACLVGRTDALQDGFDASLRIGEDVDLVWRLNSRGGRVRYEPGVEASHDTRSTLRTWMGRKFAYGTGGASLAARHGDAVAPAILTPSLAIAAALILRRSRWACAVAPLVVLGASRRLEKALPDAPERSRVAGNIAVRGLGWALHQESALLLRHWWPATLMTIGFGPVRRAAVTALVVDTLAATMEIRHPEDRIPLWILVAGRRLDDLAYGAGLWCGAIKERSARPLIPRRPRT